MAKKAKPKDDAAEFDENTPVPKGRPVGVPIAKVVILPPGENLTGLFAQWDNEGRIPFRSTLCEFVGSAGNPEGSGYRVTALSMNGTTPYAALGAAGSPVEKAKLFGLVLVSFVTLRRVHGPGGWLVTDYAVFAPKENS